MSVIAIAVVMAVAALLFGWFIVVACANGWGERQPLPRHDRRFDDADGKPQPPHVVEFRRNMSLR